MLYVKTNDLPDGFKQGKRFQRVRFTFRFLGLLRCAECDRWEHWCYSSGLGLLGSRNFTVGWRCWHETQLLGAQSRPIILSKFAGFR